MSGSFDTGAVWSGSYWVRTWGTWTDDAANNRTSFSVNAQMGASSGMWFYDHDVTGSLVVNGSTKVTYSGRYYMAGAGTTNGLTGWSGTIDHNSNNGRLNGTNDSFGVSVTFGMVNQSLSYSMPVITASTTGTATDYNRGPTTPTLTSSSRTSDGSSFSAIASGSVNNSGPAITLTLQRADNLAFTTNVVDKASTTTSGATLTDSTPTPNVTYYYRIKSSNSDGTVYSSITTSYGVPSAPTLGAVTQSTTDSGKIRVNWTAPTNTQGGITGYRIYCGTTYVATAGSAATYYDVTTTDGTTPLTVGTNYQFYVIAQNAVGYNASTSYSQSATSANTMAPGIPSIPTFGTNPPSKVGRNVTVTVVNDANGYGNAVSNYYVQYRSATTSGGTYSSWSTPVVMTTSGGNKTYTYNLLPAALWYQFRVYAKNSIVNNSAGTATYYPDINLAYTANFSPSSTGTTTMFVSAGGRRYRQSGETNPNTYQPTETAKRYGVEGALPLSQTVKYWDLTNAKRYNGTSWVDLT